MTNGPTFRLIWSTSAKLALKDRGQKARKVGQGTVLTAIVSSLNARLTSNPQSVGEIYRKRGNIEEYLVRDGMVGLDFSVDLKRMLVNVRKCTVDL